MFVLKRVTNIDKNRKSDLLINCLSFFFLRSSSVLPKLGNNYEFSKFDIYFVKKKSFESFSFVRMRLRSYLFIKHTFETTL